VSTLLQRPIHHVGYAVSDLRAAAGLWAASVGAGPFFLLPPGDFETMTHRGEPATFPHRTAFGQWGPIAIELQQIESATPQAVADALVLPGGTVNHVSYMTPDLPGDMERLEALGADQLLYAKGGPVEAAFYDMPGLAHAIELHQESPMLEGLFGMITGAAEGWDGTEPLRELQLP
jgi:catechol 2,3-dioxygenase-like lactoylglutathione lyase family enzyme